MEEMRRIKNIEKIVEVIKEVRVEIPVEKIVEKPVEVIKEVRVEVPVEKVVEKVVEVIKEVEIIKEVPAEVNKIIEELTNKNEALNNKILELKKRKIAKLTNEMSTQTDGILLSKYIDNKIKE